MPKVSVIVPVYNVENYIERCVRSLMEQTLEDMEFIFVDDCSPDNSIAILQRTISEYPNRQGQVKIRHHEKNKGLAQARVTGIESATGDFLIHCDSDDWVDLEMYEKMYQKGIEEDADVVFCDFNFYLKDKTIIYKTPVWNNDRITSLKIYINNDWHSLCNLLIKKRLYSYLNDFELNRTTQLGISMCEDYHLSLRLLLFAKKIVNVEIPLYNYNRTNENSIFSNFDEKSIESKIKADLDVIRFYREYNEYKIFESELLYRAMHPYQAWILNGEFEKFRSQISEIKNYIFKCKGINTKMKIMMWSVTHNCSWIAKSILSLRNIKERMKNGK